MNLLELMLKEEVEWPVGAEFAIQDKRSKKLCFYNDRPFRYAGEERWQSFGFIHGSSVDLPELCGQWYRRIITSEEYQAAGGWMQYSGSGVPVSGSDLCVAMLENEGSTYKAEFMGWNRAEWEGEDGVIKKYRVIKQVSVQLDNPVMESDFEPFVSVEDAQE